MHDWFLGIHLQTKTQLVAASVDVLAIDERRNDELDTISQLLRVGESNLTRVVDLGLHCGLLVELILAGNGEARGAIAAAGPLERDAHLELIVDLVIERAAEVAAVVHVGVKSKVLGGVAESKVVAR